MPDTQLDAALTDLLDADFAFSPVTASGYGLTEYDERMDDVSADAFRARDAAAAENGPGEVAVDRVVAGEPFVADRVEGGQDLRGGGVPRPEYVGRDVVHPLVVLGQAVPAGRDR